MKKRFFDKLSSKIDVLDDYLTEYFQNKFDKMFTKGFFYLLAAVILLVFMAGVIYE